MTENHQCTRYFIHPYLFIDFILKKYKFYSTLRDIAFADIMVRERKNG